MPLTHTSPNKNDLRRTMRAKRQCYPIVSAQAASQTICKKLLSLKSITQSQHIAIYLASDNEVCLAPLIEKLQQQNKTLYAPVVTEQQLQFKQYISIEQCTPNQFNILEPQQAQSFSADNCDCILVPGIAFDKSGGRLGYGKGYFDRTLAACHTHNLPITIGIAYHWQVLNTLPRDPWDQTCHHIVTEQSCFG